MKARWYESYTDGTLKCLLCPHSCVLKPGQSGRCRVRSNLGGTLFAGTWGLLSALHMDPVEKKPLYHFYPGKEILSAGSVGCNLRCRFCQNCEISQAGLNESPGLQPATAEKLVSLASSAENNIGIAFTYNEPAIWFEFVAEVASASRLAGLKNVMVTNGYINQEPLKELIGLIDAFSVDLKGFTDDFYRNITHAGLAPVLDTLRTIAASGRHLEVVNLVIPGLNDDEATFRKMVAWIRENLGEKTVLHLSAYYPRYLSKEPPTPPQTLIRLSEIAREDLAYVYAGNLAGYRNDTRCHHCNTLLISRSGYHVEKRNVSSEGVCLGCGTRVFQNF